MSNFDEILKKGKDAVAAMPSLNQREKWKHGMGLVIAWLQYMNEMYGNDKTHHMTVDLENCEICGKAAFIIAAGDIDDQSINLNFSSGDWEVVEGVLHCPKCKKG